MLTATLGTLSWRYFTFKKAPLPVWGWLGLVIILLAESLLFLHFRWVEVFFTPIVWTGYLLFADSLVYSLKGSSLMANSLRSFLGLACCSVPLWLVFEAYNLRLRNWTYVGLPQNPLLCGLGYTWSFATIWPAIFETGDLVSALGLSRDKHHPLAPSSSEEGAGVVGTRTRLSPVQSHHCACSRLGMPYSSPSRASARGRLSVRGGLGRVHPAARPHQLFLGRALLVA